MLPRPVREWSSAGRNPRLADGTPGKFVISRLPRKLPVVFLIRSLNRGGAETQLVELATRLDHGAFDVSVLTFYPGGPVWDRLAGTHDVRLESLWKRGRWDLVGFGYRLVKTLRRLKPAVLHTYLVEPSVFGLLAGRLCRVPAVVWGVRASNVDYSKYDSAMKSSFRAAALLSRFADSIVVNSHAGLEHHVRQGFPRRLFAVIPNGIDTDKFRSSREHRPWIRSRWGIGNDEIVVGVSARIDPLKGHATLVEAIRLMADRCTERTLCVRR